MSNNTWTAVVNDYAEKNSSHFNGLEVEVLALQKIAEALDDTPSGALLAEFRKFKSLLDEAKAADLKEEDEDDDGLLQPEY